MSEDILSNLVERLNAVEQRLKKVEVRYVDHFLICYSREMIRVKTQRLKP